MGYIKSVFHKTYIVSALFTLLFSCYAKPLYANDLNDALATFFEPLPQKVPTSDLDTQAQITLGKKLYFDTKLSVNNTQSCNTCHNLSHNYSGVDHLKTSIGATGKIGMRNAPTTWNAGLQIAQFWDGRAKTLTEQATLPIFNPNEMAMPSVTALIAKLSTKTYISLFQQAFPDDPSPINRENIAKALAAFQRTLISQDRFDQFLKGNKNALNDREKKGLAVFISKGCVACHNGPLLGGQLFMKMGIVHPYPNKIDRGVAHISHNSADNYFFKVPQLRNILNTAPYFHDGAAATIEQAIFDTGWHQLGIKLNKQDIAAIKDFFASLNHQPKLTKQQ